MTPEEFPQIFGYGWALSKPQAFLDHFLPLISADAVFTQPMYRRAVGHEQISRVFRALFTLLPDLVAVPTHSSVHETTVFIESTCTATLAGSRVSFGVCDRFEIADGAITERHSFSDPLPMLSHVLRHPATWPRALQARA